MKLRDAAAFSAGSLSKSPMRTLLTILGLGVGIGAILAVLTLGSAGERQVETEIDRLGVNKLWITAGEGTNGFSRGDSAAIAAATGAQTCAGAYAMAAVSMGGQTSAAQVIGYDEGAEEVHRPTLHAGRLFLPYEYETGAAVAMIDTVLQDRLGGEALDKAIDVGNRRFRVVGVLETSSPQALMQGAGCVTLPLSAFMETFDAPIAEITLSLPKGTQADAVAASALAALNGESGAYDTLSLQTEIDAARQVVRIFVTVLACVAAVCMLTGVIGVMNMLLVSVRERRQEIGLLKAVGATEGQVWLLFLSEALGYGVLGGMLGLFLGALMIRLFADYVGVAAQMSLEMGLFVWLGALALSALFGVFPAACAARLQPVEALRNDG